MTKYIDHPAAPDAPAQMSQASTIFSCRDDGDEASIKRIEEIESDPRLELVDFSKP
jgi:hypothetical protein